MRKVGPAHRERAGSPAGCRASGMMPGAGPSRPESPAARRASPWIAILLSAGSLLAPGSEAIAQGDGEAGVPLDRWLVTWPVTTLARADGVDPLLGEDGQPIFPDRNVVAGPGYWSLVRRAPPSPGPAAGPWIDLERDYVDPPVAGASPTTEATALAHAYLRSPADRSLRMAISRSSCRRVSGWLNGQPIAFRAPEVSEPAEGPVHSVEIADVRLGPGWNTLLIAVSEGDCPGRLGGWLRRWPLPSGRGEEPGGTEGIRVQASRPHGVRRSLPAGFVEVSGLALGEALAWEAGAEDLKGSLTVRLTAWGRTTGEPPPSSAPVEPPRPSAPPEIDLSGRWDLQVFAPTGIAEATAELAMAEDGTLTGRVRGARMGGDLGQGWVSGRDFRFTIEAGRRTGRLTYTGRASIAGDSIRGTVVLGGAPDLSSGFRGARLDPDRAKGEEEGPGEVPAELPAPDAGAGGPPGGDADPTGRPPGGPLQGARDPFIRQQLLPPLETRPPAPARARVRLEAGGERPEMAVGGLEAARTRAVEVQIPFDDLREASLSPTRVKLRVEWGKERRELVRGLPPGLLLDRLHGPIVLDGWREVEEAGREGVTAGSPRRRLAGTWRIPPALSGFSLELRTNDGRGDYRLRGQALGVGRKILCAPCREGERLELEVLAPPDWEGTPTARIVEPGYPAAAADPSAPAAREWLRALGGGGNRRYLELSARFSGREGT